MATPIIHPSRAAFFSDMEQPSTTPAAEPEPLPPDVEAARKQRINLDLISALKLPCPSNTTASIQGIGLYTHAAPPAQTSPSKHGQNVNLAPEPVFVPIGGTQRLSRLKNAVPPRISNEVADLYKKLQQEMHAEEKHFGHGGVSMDKLKERYGGLDVPQEDEAAIAELQPQPELQQMLESLRKAVIGQDDRRVSLGGGVTGDIVMGGAEQEQFGAATVTKTGNTYEAARDPRLRGR
ncbi:hypothetical protein FB567DRAFT_316072 [Paraphoma chrysanthemicola]|uniref:Uncharacterized protein n=1 Tax=Paraphoma chrysanthemicola TaxID=798071 RepID=A0A8K0R9J6_9PLEO|nr:hypothetical protein FB567DRAFT_316072 [Paraphoma chrysanthemicola]